MKDKFITGFIPGLIMPLAGSYIYHLLFFNYMDTGRFYKHIISNNLFISVLSIGVILNLALFFLFYQLEKDQSARGVIGSTFIYAFIVLYFKVLS
jgi:hypothetical protein